MHVFLAIRGPEEGFRNLQLVSEVSEVKVLLGTVPSNFIVDLNSSQCVNLHMCVCVCVFQIT